ncbi:MAG: hypothetical protein KY445_07835 [Armatimonadetes bacterium]|nr:hypothetical protein [Armatimonadota bacterium]
MDILDEQKGVVNRLSETEAPDGGTVQETAPEAEVPAATVTPEETGRAIWEKWQAKGDNYGMPDEIGFAYMFLEDLAKAVGGKSWQFSDLRNYVGTRLGFDACKAALDCIGEAMPTPEELTANVYWAAMEVLDVAGLDFGALVEYHHTKDDGEVEA